MLLHAIFTLLLWLVPCLQIVLADSVVTAIEWALLQELNLPAYPRALILCSTFNLWHLIRRLLFLRANTCHKSSAIQFQELLQRILLEDQLSLQCLSLL